jgi:hypothetical protein
MARRIAIAAFGLFVVVAAVAWAVTNSRDGARPSGPRAAHVDAYRHDDTTLATCERFTDRRRRDCQSQAFANIAWEEGGEIALERLAELARKDRQVQSDCHRLAHAIGGAVLQRTDDITEALHQGSDLCISGYGHGVFEYWAAADPKRGQRVMDGDIAFCTERQAGSPPLQHECEHGVGHGIALLSGGDMRRGIAACERAFEADAKTCVSGMMMEVQYFERLESGTPSKTFRRCSDVDPKYQRPCYHAVGAGEIARSVPGRWAVAARVCRRVPAEYQSTCALATGETVAELSVYDPHVIATTCRASISPAACAEGAAGLAARFGGEAFAAVCAALEHASSRRVPATPVPYCHPSAPGPNGG